MIKRKEVIMGRDSQDFLRYFTETVKVFNQVGMGMMNSDRIKESQHMFKSLISFLSAFEVKCGSHVPHQVKQLLVLTLNNLGCAYKR